jgi:hypothetical protein
LQDFKKQPAGREKIFFTRLFLIPVWKHEFQHEQRCLRHAIEKRRSSRTVLHNLPKVCGEITQSFSEFVASSRSRGSEANPGAASTQFSRTARF